MPVQETGAKLWFDTEEEAKAYDLKIISNIEIKEGDDVNSPHYTYLASRVRKEKFPNYSQKYFDAVNKILTIDETPRYLEHSYRFWHNFTFEKYFLGVGVTYLLLRELPIRNFYARSFIMSIAFINFHNNFRIRGLQYSTKTNMMVDESIDLA